MNKPKLLASTGATPGKLALIGVLAVVMLIVIVVQFSGSSSPPPSKPPTARPVAANPNNPQNAINPTAATGESALQAWPIFSLESALAYDPFAAPAWTRPNGEIDNAGREAASDAKESEAAAADRELLAALQTDGVSLVMITDGRRIAHVGQRQLREGDQIGGFVVQEISTNGVVLVENPVQ